MIVLLIGGFGLLALGVYIRFGGFKTLFLAKGIPVLMPRALQNIPIPLGIILLLFLLIGTFVPTVSMRQALLTWFIMPLFVLSLVIAVWPPRWLRPQWLNYLEDEYGSVMWHLLEDVHNPREWTRRVRTQAGLEEWAEETRKKLGYPPHPGQIERKAKERERKG
jgi:hypothetical protein